MSFVPKRIVFDTSSLVPVCLHPEREPAQIFRYVLLHHQLFASSAVLEELKTVLSRQKFDLWRPAQQRLAWFKRYQAAVTCVEPLEQVEDCRDPKDNKFLSLALAANADVLVASDIHLLELHPYRSIDILRLGEFKGQYCLGLSL